MRLHRPPEESSKSSSKATSLTLAYGLAYLLEGGVTPPLRLKFATFTGANRHLG